MNNSDIEIVNDFLISIKIDDILKSLRKETKGNKLNYRKPSKKILDEIQHNRNIIDELSTPKGIYRIVDSETLEPRYLFKRAKKTILAACTIGNEIDKRIDDLIQSKKLSSAVILDTIASLATEEIASELNKYLNNKIAEKFSDYGYEYTNRFSPGYCNWTLSGQKMIFSLINPKKIKITLNESMMMIPRKSVSFAINIGPNVDNTLGNRECENCSIINCAFRKSVL